MQKQSKNEKKKAEMQKKAKMQKKTENAFDFKIHAKKGQKCKKRQIMHFNLKIFFCIFAFFYKNF